MAMRVSIITVSHNSVATIDSTVSGVLAQSYPDIEYIVVDGASTDGTVQALSKYEGRISKLISEPDRGIYDALNKGIKLATGDIVGILHSDDLYSDNRVIQHVVDKFEATHPDAIFADLVYVRPNNLDRVVRFYSGAGFTLQKFSYGWMPPHPTFFAKRECYAKYGLFKTDYRIAADYELLARFMVRHNIRCEYLPEVLIKMRTGGVSTKSVLSNITLNREILRACRENYIPTSFLKIYSKYFTKLWQLIDRPK